MTARVTPDGRHLLFQSSTGAGLTGYDSNHHVELYLYSADSHSLQCVSCRPDGSSAEGDARDNARAFTGATGTSSHLSTALSADGRYVFFTTSDSLLPRDTNGVADAYDFDSSTGTVHLLSSGTSPDPSYFMDASADGHDVFFTTRQRLLGWDTDGANDLYDARLEGGLPEPAPRPARCLGAEPCHGPPPAAPAPPPPAFEGPPNRRPCRPGKVRRHGKCLPRKHHRRHRRANHHRRVGR
jgi:hypothetical protein